MKNRAFYDRIADVFPDGPIHGRGSGDVMLLVRAEASFEKRVGTPEHILRWEDDGGPAFEAEAPIPKRDEIDALHGDGWRQGAQTTTWSTGTQVQ